MTRAVIYARVSSDDRAKEGRNLAGQVEDGRAYCTAHDYQVAAELAEDDRGASGAAFDLPQLSRALALAGEGAYDVLVVREIDRLSRSLAKQLLVEEELKRHGVEIEYILQNYEKTPEGQLRKLFGGTISEYERLKTIERTQRGKRKAVESGGVMVNAHPPYGYALTRDGAIWALTVVEEEVRIIHAIYDMYSNQGMSFYAIAQHLTSLNIPSPADARGGWKRSPVGVWSDSTVRNILSNETYTGTWYYRKKSGDPIPVEVPAIVDQQAYQAARAQVEKNKIHSRRNRVHDYLLNTRVICGSCGLRMQARTATHRRKPLPYYYCPNRNKNSPRTCSLPSSYFGARQVDSTVWSWLYSVVSNPGTLLEMFEAYNEQQEQVLAVYRQHAETLDELISRHQRQLDKLLDLYLADDFPKEVLLERKQCLTETIQSLEVERGKLEIPPVRVLDVRDILAIQNILSQAGETLRAHADSPRLQRELVESLDVEVTLNKDGGQQWTTVTSAVGEIVLLVDSSNPCIDLFSKQHLVVLFARPVQVGWY